jgi:hypothetical protein
MNATNNKRMSVLVTAIATAAIMVIGPVTGVNPVFGLGHYHEGDNDSGSQEYDRFEDCLSNHEHESDNVTEEQIEHCIDLAYNGQSDESSREDNDDSDDDDDREDMQRAEEDEQEEKEDLAFFGDDSEDSSSNNFNNDSDFADDENSSTG